jgi:hypothetical protein
MYGSAAQEVIEDMKTVIDAANAVISAAEDVIAESEAEIKSNTEEVCHDTPKLSTALEDLSWIERSLRETALSSAVAWTTSEDSGDFSSSETVDIAEEFYNFLKGN